MAVVTPTISSDGTAMDPGCQVLAIDVVRDSKVVATLTPKCREYKGEWTDPAPAAGVHYYYVRVTQADGELAWGSPMWIEVGK